MLESITLGSKRKFFLMSKLQNCLRFALFKVERKGDTLLATISRNSDFLALLQLSEATHSSKSNASKYVFKLFVNSGPFLMCTCTYLKVERYSVKSPSSSQILALP